MKTKALLVAFSLLSAHLVSAAPITFNFITEGSVSAGTYAFTNSGLTITATGYKGLTADSINLDTLATVVKSTSSNGGLGVQSGFSGDTGNELDQSQAGIGEALLFSFSSRVKLESVTFTAVNGGDDFDFAFGDGAAPSGPFLLTSQTVVSPWDVSALSYGGTHFLFASIDAAGESGEDRFKISSITVNLAPVTATPTAAVPENGSLLAMLSGSLLALAWFARRQR